MKITELLTESAKKGLYYYVNKRKKAGTSRSKNNPKAPSEQEIRSCSVFGIASKKRRTRTRTASEF